MTVAIIGAGVMGETLLSGLIRGGRDVADLMVGEKRPDRATELREKYKDVVPASIPKWPGGDWDKNMKDGWYRNVAPNVDRSK